METHQLRTRWLASGYGTALAAFVVSAIFWTDVLGQYVVKTTYFLGGFGYWYELTYACIAAAAGAILACATYWRR